MAAKKTKRAVKKTLKAKPAKTGGFTIAVGPKLAKGLMDKAGGKGGLRAAKTYAINVIEKAAT